MSKRYEKIVVIFLLILCGIIILQFLSLFLNPSENRSERAMIKYLEKKYDEDVTCTNREFHGGSYMVPGGYWECEFSSNKHPGLVFECSAHDAEGLKKYKFLDNYQANYYLPDVQRLMEETAGKYFEGEYYVVTDTIRHDSEEVDIMSFEEVAKRYDQYKVYIYVYNAPIDDICDAMLQFVEDVEAQGFQFTFYLGKNINDDKEKFIEYVEKKDSFNGDDYVEWIYYKDLHSEEGKEPDIFIING